MATEIITCHPTELARKIKELTNNGDTIISTSDTSKPIASDAHGASYGGAEVSIVVERKINKSHRRVFGMLGGPLNPGEVPY
jgi:hypothetical protein